MTFLDNVVGSFSVGAADNPTVAMMDAAFANEALDWRYINCDVPPDQLGAAVAGAWAMGWQGFNCSMPHKQTVIPLLDRLTKSAELCRAVNCVTRTANGWDGHNTDGSGFLASVVDVLPMSGAEMLMIGSGGAAHAIAVAAADAGAASLHIASRNPATASSLAQLIDGETPASATVYQWSEPVVPPASVDLIVNATPVGSGDAASEDVAVDFGAVGGQFVAADVVFNPAETVFLRRARSAGATTVDGTGMLVNQAAENIRLWTGSTPDTRPMRAALESALGLR